MVDSLVPQPNHNMPQHRSHRPMDFDDLLGTSSLMKRIDVPWNWHRLGGTELVLDMGLSTGIKKPSASDLSKKCSQSFAGVLTVQQQSYIIYIHNHTYYIYIFLKVLNESLLKLQLEVSRCLNPSGPRRCVMTWAPRRLLGVSYGSTGNQNKERCVHVYAYNHKYIFIYVR